MFQVQPFTDHPQNAHFIYKLYVFIQSVSQEV